MVIRSMQLTKDTVEKARSFAKQVYERKLSRADKFKTGQEEQADFEGFLFEFAVCDFFRHPRPELFEGQTVDEFDILLDGKRFDVKHSKNCLINKAQYEYKKNKIDAFLFGNTVLLDFETKALFADIYGWIDYKDVPEVSKVVNFKNESEAYKVPKGALKDAMLLREKNNGGKNNA